MAVSMQEPNQENQADRYPLLMEPQENNENRVHFIDIERGCDASSSGSSHNGHENPRTPLFAWIVGYAVGCAASLPLLFWRYLHRNQGTEQGSTQLRQDSSQGNSTSEPNSYITISLTRASEEEDGQNTSSGTRIGQIMGPPNARLSALMDHLKMALDCFFAVWFVVGNVWIFGGNSSSSDAPNLYRLCIVFLTFSCIGYAMPFILCSVICCCLPCIISFLGVCDEMNRLRGASEETINALPTHKFKLKDKGSRSNSDSNPGVDEGGSVAAGTEREHVISGEDAVCRICLARYADNDELRELPCSHFFNCVAFAWRTQPASVKYQGIEVTRLIIGNKLPLNSATSLLLGVAFESKLEPVPEEEDDDEPDEVEAEVGSESVVELMLLESTPASLKIFASGESGERLSKAVNIKQTISEFCR
ncbi:E3 ubiquitin-protein ligase [Camellia lanceoleosa]|nr:E3 ubiquitin-protein ligase [Camellia lanceoleosa]